jgi:hypothetical protein
VRHERVAALLSEYLDGSLSARDALGVEAHLLACERCRLALGELHRTVDLLRSLRGSVDAPDVAARVMARVRAGEGGPSALARLRAMVSSFFSGPLGAPLATAGVGLALFVLLPRIEVEVSIPGRARAPAATAERATEPRARAAERSPAASPPLLSRRTGEALSHDPFACLEARSPQACREHHESLTRLALRDVWRFMERVEAVPEPRREDLLRDLSRFAAESGAAPDVAAQLRATGDPQAQRMAVRFEEAR